MIVVFFWLLSCFIFTVETKEIPVEEDVYSKVPIFTEEYLSRGAKKEQPRQVELPVEYDSNLSAPFFDSIKWSYPWYGQQRSKN